MSLKLRDLIRNVRACKTAKEEREVIAKECAEIRTAFRTKDDSIRHRNVAKLLYIHMLGYPTHFGQMEAMKLVAAPRFAEKRIGYLALMLLLDESHDVLVLVTNSLKNDFGASNPHVAGLALTAMGNMCSADIARDLAREVFHFFTHSNSYLRKKAVLCAVRIIRKVPEMVEDVSPLIPALLSDKVHSVQLTAATLMLEVIKIDRSYLQSFRTCVPRICQVLKTLIASGFVIEYDVNGIADPFLQGRLLELLRLLCMQNKEASIAAQEVLAQIAINTDATKSSGAAVLYECIQTIMSIEAEPALRVLAVNALGRFLQSRDNNLRYVALNTLCKVVYRDAEAVQRHRNTVVDCLKDPDVSIRSRALDLLYALVTKNNVRALIRELLNYLSLTSGDVEFKTDLTSKICTIVDRFAPSRRWHIDTLIEVLTVAGEYSKDNVLVDLCSLISRSPALQGYATHRLVAAFERACDRRARHGLFPNALGSVTAWVVGEFGDSLLSSEVAAKVSKEYQETLRSEAEFDLQMAPADGDESDDQDEKSGSKSKTRGADSNVGKVRSALDVLDIIERALRAPPPPATVAGFSTPASQALASHSNSATFEVVRQASLTAVAKLAVRFSEANSLSGDVLKYINELLSVYISSSSTEMQQRSSEYTQLVQGDSSIRDHVLAPLPQLAPSKKPISMFAGPASEEAVVAEEDDDEEEEDEEEEDEEDEKPASQAAGSSQQASAPAPVPVMDLFGLLGSTGSVVSPPVQAQSNTTTTSASSFVSPADSLLNDLFGTSPSSNVAASSASPAEPIAQSTAPAASPFDIFGSVPAASEQQAPVSDIVTFPSETVFEQDDLQVVFDFSRNVSTPHILNVVAHYRNKSTTDDLTDFEMQLAVPGHLKRELKPASSSVIPQGGESVQTMVLTNEMYGKKKTLVKTRFLYKTNGNQVTKEAAIAKFPA